MKSILLILLSSFTLFAYSQVPTHCKKDEFSLLNAKMGKIQKDKFISNDKILSLCADKTKEPYGSLAYRYGKLGNIEIENIATIKSKMFIYYEPTSSQTSDNLFWFKKGNYQYVVSNCMGKCFSGIFLYVLQNGKKIAELVSPDSELYESNLSDINMEKVKSPIFKIEYPDGNLN